ncbi:HlyD family efflux transporter periplasmic adaptor subunit [Adonisia turfae]|uniref:HlyD family efflux transporter periplasmic adaptor subunit n=1 Tax=Adonisia turfae CCMR0081 TaxID=2292702 RepID=A0A6M0RPB3_9CYAN|nr:HlyD family efflux transporter periplasmic adaptor subunit [Adonisia turfae]NEZ57602.1 HlyD family efflux transporter periplasmic adaptor subunit [Adonisia turfae CCMR0081]
MPNSLNGHVAHAALLTPLQGSKKQQKQPELQKDSPLQPITQKSSPVLKADWSHATEELLDSMPQVWTRGLLYLLLLFVAVVLPWAMFSRVDETGTARGRLEPKGQTLRLDTEVAGSIATIQVEEGDRVEVGQQLLILDSELIEVELRQTQEQRDGQADRLAQLNLLRNQLTTTLTIQQQQNQAQALERKTQIDQATQQIEHARTELDLRVMNLASAKRELNRYRTLYEQEIIPKVEVVEHEDVLMERQRLYEQAQADVIQAKLQQQERLQSYDSLLHTGELSMLQIQEELKNLETQITQLTSEIAQSTHAIQSFKLQLEQRVITSPVAGIIFELPFQQAGAVVQPGSKVAEIAPEGATFIVNAQIATTESGSLREGLPVKLKFDAYSFQDYGIATGTVASISPTSRVEETIQGDVDTYQLEIELDQPCLPTPQECLPLRPGDTATAEVIVQQRRIVDIILDPFKKLSKDGLQL